MNQEKVWDKIAEKWAEYKTTRNDITDKFLRLGKGKKVLDLGCGSGRNFIKTKATIYGVDFSKEMLKFARIHANNLGIDVELIKNKATKLEFEDNFFDSGILVAVLHCIRRKRKRKKEKP